MFCLLEQARLSLENFQPKFLLFSWESKSAVVTSTTLQTGWASSQLEVMNDFMKRWTALRAKSIIPLMPETPS